MSSLERARDRAAAWAVFWILLAAYVATFAGVPENPDAEVEFQTASALVRSGTLALGGTTEADAIVGIAHQGRQGFNVRAGKPGREHEFFSWSGVGQPLVALPFYVAGAAAARVWPAIEARHAQGSHLGVAQSEYFEHLVVGLRNPLLGALTGALLVVAALRTGARRSFAFLCGLSYGLCSYAWPQARGTLSDVQATAALFLAFVLAEGELARLERDEAARSVALSGAGIALGLAFATRPVLAPGVAVLALYFVLRAIRLRPSALPLRELAALALPALACLAVVLALNQRRFGSLLEFGYGGVVGSDWFLRAPWQGLVGVTVSPGSGLVWLAPPLVLSLAWLALELRGARPLPLLLLAQLVAIGLVHALIPSWHGAWSYGPRYLLPLVPFLWLPLGLALEHSWRHAVPRALALLLLLLGAVTALGGVLVEYTTALDLTLQAARLEWPSAGGIGGADELALDDERFLRAKFDRRFAEPWVHWRILRHRLTEHDERFPARELFSLDRDDVLTPQWERWRGFRPLAWVDLRERLGGPAWPGPVLVVGLLILGLRSLRRTRAVAHQPG